MSRKNTFPIKVGIIRSVLNILLLTETLDGGEWFSVTELAKNIKKYKPETNLELVALSHPTVKKFSDFRKVYLIPNSGPQTTFSFFKLLKRFLALRSKIDKVTSHKKVDFIVSTNYLMLLAAFSLFKKTKICFWYHGSKIKLMTNERNLRWFAVSFLEYLALLVSDFVISPSKKIRFRKLINNKLFLLPNFLDEAFLIPKNRTRLVSEFRKHHVPFDRKKIIYVGRIDPPKGLENLTRSIIKIKESGKFKNLVLIVCYLSKSADKILLKKMRSVNQGGGVVFLPDLLPKSLSCFYQGSDLCILPSEQELSPRIIYEAFASNIPVLGTKETSHELLKIDKRLILKNNSVTEISKGINYFFNLKQRSIRQLKSKIKSIEYQYDSKSNVEIFFNILNKV